MYSRIADALIVGKNKIRMERVYGIAVC